MLPDGIGRSLFAVFLRLQEVVNDPNIPLTDANPAHYVPELVYVGPLLYGKAKATMGVDKFSLIDNN